MPMVPGPQTSWVMSTSTLTQTLSSGRTWLFPACLARIFSVIVIPGIAATPQGRQTCKYSGLQVWLPCDVAYTARVRSQVPDYQRLAPRREFARPRPGSVTAWLIFLNILVYVADPILYRIGWRYEFLGQPLKPLET